MWAPLRALGGVTVFLSYLRRLSSSDARRQERLVSWSPISR